MLQRLKDKFSPSTAPASTPTSTPAPPTRTPAWSALPGQTPPERTAARTALPATPFADPTRRGRLADWQARRTEADARSKIERLVKRGDLNAADGVIAAALQTTGTDSDTLLRRTGLALRWINATREATPERVAELVPRLILPALHRLSEAGADADSKAGAAKPRPPTAPSLQPPVRAHLIAPLLDLARASRFDSAVMARCLQPLPREFQMAILLALPPERARVLLESSLAIATATTTPEASGTPPTQNLAVREAWTRIEPLAAAIAADPDVASKESLATQQALWTALAVTFRQPGGIGSAARIKLFKAASTHWNAPAANQAALRGILQPVLRYGLEGERLTRLPDKERQHLQRGIQKAKESHRTVDSEFLILTAELVANPVARCCAEIRKQGHYAYRVVQDACAMLAAEMPLSDTATDHYLGILEQQAATAPATDRAARPERSMITDLASELLTSPKVLSATARARLFALRDGELGEADFLTVSRAHEVVMPAPATSGGAPSAPAPASSAAPEAYGATSRRSPGVPLPRRTTILDAAPEGTVPAYDPLVTPVIPLTPPTQRDAAAPAVSRPVLQIHRSVLRAAPAAAAGPAQGGITSVETFHPINLSREPVTARALPGTTLGESDAEEESSPEVSDTELSLIAMAPLSPTYTPPSKPNHPLARARGPASEAGSEPR